MSYGPSQLRELTLLRVDTVSNVRAKLIVSNVHIEYIRSSHADYVLVIFVFMLTYYIRNVIIALYDIHIAWYHQ